MKLRNKILSYLCVVFLIGIIYNCVNSALLSTVYDNVEKIAEKDDKDTFWTRTMYTENTEKTGNFHLQYTDFSGDEKIWFLTSKENGSITFNYDSTVNSGDFKVVLVKNNKEIENILEGTFQGNGTIKLTGGEYRIKIVGRKASGNIKFSITESKNVAMKI